MLRQTLVLGIVALAGCGANNAGVPSIAEPQERKVRQLFLPNDETLPEIARGKKVYESWRPASAGELTYRILECKWERPNLAVVSWSVTNTGSTPIRPSHILILSIDGWQSRMFTELVSRSEFNFSDNLNPQITRSGKSRFELPPQGKFVIGAESPTTGDVVLFDCDLDQHAYVTVDQ